MLDIHTKMIEKIGVIFLLIHLTHLFKTDEEQIGFSSEEEKCDDIAIIGAGIAGTYAGWRLRNDNKHITIYEFSNRVGGRMYTVKFPGIPDINVELGAWRFLPDFHKLLNETVNKLGLKIIDFKLGSLPYPDTMMYIRGTHLRYDELTTSKSPFKLNPKELKEPNQLQWEIYRNNTDVLTTNLNVPENEKMFHVKTLDGIPLYKQSVQSVFHKSISTEAQNYLRETFPFDTVETDKNAALQLRTSPPSNALNVVKTVASGFNSIPVRLLDVFLAANPRHKLSLNRHLIAIRKRYDGRYALYFEPTVTENDSTYVLKERRLVKKCAKKIMLAINRLSLEQLEWDALHEPLVREYLTQAIKDVHAAKLFLAYDKPWWRQSDVYERYVISDTFLRQTFDFGTSNFSQNSVLHPMYLDNDVSMWAELAKRTRHFVTDTNFVFTVSNETIQMTHKYLSEIFKIDANFIPQPIHGILATWNTYPYGGAWQKWMPGYKVYDVQKKMVKPSEYDDVFVACNGFDVSFGTSSESALRVVELALKYMRSSSLAN